MKSTSVKISHLKRLADSPNTVWRPGSIRTSWLAYPTWSCNYCNQMIVCTRRTLRASNLLHRWPATRQWHALQKLSKMDDDANVMTMAAGRTLYTMHQYRTNQPPSPSPSHGRQWQRRTLQMLQPGVIHVNGFVTVTPRPPPGRQSLV